MVRMYVYGGGRIITMVRMYVCGGRIITMVRMYVCGGEGYHYGLYVWGGRVEILIDMFILIVQSYQR